MLRHRRATATKHLRAQWHPFHRTFASPAAFLKSSWRSSSVGANGKAESAPMHAWKVVCTESRHVCNLAHRSCWPCFWLRL